MNRKPFEEMDYKPTYENVFCGEYAEQRLARRRVVCAACRVGEFIFAGARHFDAVMATQVQVAIDYGVRREAIANAEQGFIDQFGVFMTREEAWKIAVNQKQIINEPSVPGTLFSEDLY